MKVGLETFERAEDNWWNEAAGDASGQAAAGRGNNLRQGEGK